MIKIVAFKNIPLQNQKPNDLETWHEALRPIRNIIFNFNKLVSDLDIHAILLSHEIVKILIFCIQQLAICHW